MTKHTLEQRITSLENKVLELENQIKRITPPQLCGKKYLLGNSSLVTICIELRDHEGECGIRRND